MIPSFVRHAEPDQIEHLLQITPVVAAGATLGALFVWLNFSHGPLAASADAWFAAFCAIAAARIAASLSFFRRRRPRLDRYQTWLVWAALSSLAHASCWIAFAVLVPGPGDAAAETILHVVVAATAMGATMHLASFYPLLVVYVLLTLVPLVLRDVFIGGAEHLTLAALGVVIGGYSLLTSGGHARALAQMLAQRRQNAALIVALKNENRAAIEARESAVAANASKVRLFAAANHDLRQPLHAASLLTASLEHARCLDDVRPLSRRIASCIDSLGDLVDAMLELSQLDSGDVKPHIRRFDVGGLVRQVVNANEPQAAAKQLELTADEASVWVESDRKMVLRVLSNLVNNAVRYTEAGSVQVRVRTEGQRVSVTVRDTGTGIPPHEMPRIFEEFYQVNNPARDRQRGLGLGLATSRRISDRLGLELTARSVHGAGSEFSFVLPLSAAQAPARPAAASCSVIEEPAARRILLVEDDAESRQALELLLKRFWSGLEVQTARDPAEALCRLSLGFVPDVIVTDLRLGPGMDGMALIKAARQRLRWPVPAILVSGDVAANAVRREEGGQTIVLRKPVKAVQLRSVAERAFSQVRRLDAGGSAISEQAER